jgi:short-subunit dehydrogenase
LSLPQEEIMLREYAGKTILITGASSGLGAEFARAFAARGARLVLVARREERLEKLAKELHDDHDTESIVIAKDLQVWRAGADLASELARRGIRVDVVVNNAGFGSHKPVVDENPNMVADEIALNVGTLVDLSRAFLPGMIQRNDGVIVNVASTAAFQSLPFLAVYAATKAFVLSFTEGLWGELEGTNVHALAVCPGPTATEFFDRAKSEAFGGPMQSASEVVHVAMKALDRRRPAPFVISGRVNWWGAFASRLAPRKSVIRLGRRIMQANRPQ